MMSILFASIIWFSVFFMREIWIWSILVSVTSQEVARFIFFYLFDKASTSKFMRTSENNNKKMASFQDEIAIGVGTALAHGFIMYGSILWNASGPGSFYSESCPHIPIFLTSGNY